MTIARVAELAELARAIVVASTLHVSLPLGFLRRGLIQRGRPRHRCGRYPGVARTSEVGVEEPIDLGLGQGSGLSAPPRPLF